MPRNHNPRKLKLANPTPLKRNQKSMSPGTPVQTPSKHSQHTPTPACTPCGTLGTTCPTHGPGYRPYHMLTTPSVGNLFFTVFVAFPFFLFFVIPLLIFQGTLLSTFFLLIAMAVGGTGMGFTQFLDHALKTTLRWLGVQEDDLAVRALTAVLIFGAIGLAGIAVATELKVRRWKREQAVERRKLKVQLENEQRMMDEEWDGEEEDGDGGDEDEFDDDDDMDEEY